MVILFDGTRFYASAAGVYQPELRNKPLAVVTANSGIIIALNKLASQLSVRKFEPIFKYKNMVEHGQLFTAEANFNLFGTISNDMHEQLEKLVPDIYRYSIDEAFGLLPACESSDVVGYLKRIRRTVYKNIRIPIGAAAARNCTLVKVASWAAKNVEGYNGICVLENTRTEEAILARLEIGKTWGIGQRLAPKFQMLSINTALDLKRYKANKLRSFGKPIQELHAELNGEIVHDWRRVQLAEQQQIGSSRSMQNRLQTIHEVKQALAYHLSEVASKARASNQKIKRLVIFCCGSRFDKTPIPPVSVTIDLEYPTHDLMILLPVLQANIELLTAHLPIYKVGVKATELCSARYDQQDLFAPKENQRLMNTLDNINARYGKKTLYLGSLGVNVADEQIGERCQSPTLKNSHSRWSDIPLIF